MLQQHSSLKTIKKKLIRKALDMIRKLAEEDPDEYSNKDKTGNWVCCDCQVSFSIYDGNAEKTYFMSRRRKKCDGGEKGPVHQILE
jgi:hypothetical protein